MTLALTGYSGVFMRYALAVQPKNYLLFGCHVVNFTAQLTQGYRFVDYWYMGGRDKSLKAKADQGLSDAEAAVGRGVKEAKEVGREAEAEVKKGVEKVTGR